MDFLDDLDDAFDQIMGDGQEDIGAMAEREDFGMPDSLGELKKVLAEENRVQVLALLAAMNQLRRTHFIAALAGAVDYLAPLEMENERHACLQGLSGMLRTKRKRALRKGLAAIQLGELAAARDVLGPNSDEAATKAVTDYVKRLSQSGGANNEEAYKLFRVGIWNWERLMTGQAEDLGLLAHLSGERIESLRALE